MAGKTSVMLCLTLIAVAGPASLARSEDAKASPIEIEAPWSRASIGAGGNGVVYLTLTNRGDAEDRLLGVDTPVARSASVHETVMHGGHMSMEPLEVLVIAPGERVELRPSGLHIMLMGLRAPLVEGETFALTLRFERAGEREVEVRVEKMGARQPSVHESNARTTESD